MIRMLKISVPVVILFYTLPNRFMEQKVFYCLLLERIHSLVVFGIFVRLPELKNVLKMKKIILLLGVIALVASCTKSSNSVQSIPTTGKSIVIDVRSVEEWNNDGHANCSTNFPLDELEMHKAELALFDTITFVCLSGGRAGQAADWAQSNFPKKIIQNGGAWENVACNK